MSAARRSRRVPSEQISQSSQAQRIAEDVEGVSEDEAPRRTKVKKEKKSTRQRAEAIEEHENAGPAEQETTSEDVFDKYKYLNQPLNAESGIRIRGFAGDWGTARDAFRIDAVEMAKAVAGSMAEFCQGKEDQTGMEDLDKVMKSLLDHDRFFLLHQQALEEVHQKVKTGESIADMTILYEDILKDKKDAYNKKTTRQKYAKDEDYLQFQQGIFEVTSQGEAMPLITEIISREDGDESDDDDDIQVGGVTQDYKCPISLTMFVNPMTSQTCQHSFSKDSIREYLKSGAKKCPAAGCNKMLTMADMKEDKQLARRVRDATRREQMRNQRDSDDDDVIE